MLLPCHLVVDCIHYFAALIGNVLYKKGGKSSNICPQGEPFDGYRYCNEEVHIVHYKVEVIVSETFKLT